MHDDAWVRTSSDVLDLIKTLAAGAQFIAPPQGTEPPNPSITGEREYTIDGGSVTYRVVAPLGTSPASTTWTVYSPGDVIRVGHLWRVEVKDISGASNDLHLHIRRVS